jgi:hypothetical protein
LGLRLFFRMRNEIDQEVEKIVIGDIDVKDAKLGKI